MAKILRKAYKIFGSSASAAAGGLEQFGALAAGAVNYTVDVETLQALTAWADGWSAACLGNNSPVLEERNAVDYVHGYQIGYLLQQGIPEWLSTQTYYKGNYVVDSDGKLRVSVIDNNTGNDPSLDNGGQYWGFGGGSGSGKAIGEVFLSQSSSAADNPGSLPLFTGETIASADTVYPEFYAWVNSHADLQISAADYETALSTYGECPKYVIDTVNKTIRLPKLVNYLKMANTTDKITQSADGLPNITAYIKGMGGWLPATQTGAFYATEVGQRGTGSDNNETALNFDASLSNAKYGASNDVTPKHTTLYPWVCAYDSAIPASVAQAAEFQNALSGKADIDLDNLSNAGKIVASGLGMPSSSYDDLTLGADGANYTAPADGYFFLHKSSGTVASAYLVGTNNSAGGFYDIVWGPNFAADDLSLIVPAKSGDSVTIGYTANGTTKQFRFIYAEGSKSLA